jgi:hypothetical protein
MTRDEIIDTAKELISGQRAKDYGDAKNNFDRIAEGWNIIVREAAKANSPITAKHVALMMDWVKTCRLLETIDHQDSWVDKVGYSALGGSFEKD